jgi:hypothetical protein
MNFSCLIPGLAGGLLALVSVQQLEKKQAPSPRLTTVPAVVRLVAPRHAASATSATDARGWSSMETLLDQNPGEFRKRTGEEIEACALALDGMVRRANLGTIGSRSYLQTRLQALREHVDYARTELVKLPASQGDEDFISAHAHFYRTLKSLEQAFSQAANELNGDI